MNKLIEWKDEYNLGVGGLDHEHVEWVDRANRVISALEAGSPPSAVNDAFFDLLDITVKHFDLEESHMELAYYPDLARHRSLHDRHIRDLVRFQGRCHRGEVSGEGLSAR